jgi:hypothetical protein
MGSCHHVLCRALKRFTAAWKWLGIDDGGGGLIQSLGGGTGGVRYAGTGL